MSNNIRQDGQVVRVS